MSLPDDRARLLAAIHAYRSGVVDESVIDGRLSQFEAAVADAAGDSSGDARTTAELLKRIRDLEHQVRAIRADRDAMARAKTAARRQLDERSTLDRLRELIVELREAK